MMIVLGADIGGTHITTALIDRNSGEMIPGSYYREFVDAQGSADFIISSWAAVLKKSMEKADGVHKLGIAMPGPFDYHSGISLIRGLHKYDALYGMNVKNLLADALGFQAADIKMANDARCFLQGEIFAGAVKGEKNVTGLTLGTGFGSAVASDGVVYEGTYYDSPFGDSRAEDYFCSRWLVKRYEELSGKPVKNVKEMVALADAPADTAFSEFGANLGDFLSMLQPVPPRILLGGNIAQAYPLFSAALHATLQDKKREISFVLSVLDENAALLGAASIIG